MTPARTLYCSLAAAATFNVAATAQPVVPKGFTARLIAPLLEDQVPELEAIDDDDFGRGVVTAAAGNNIVTFRLISPAGTISTFGVLSGLPDILDVRRIRLDRDDVIDGRLHCTVISDFPQNTTTRYVTVSSAGVVTTHWIRDGAQNRQAYDFEFVPPEIGFGAGSLLIDAAGNDSDPTTLAFMDTSYDFSILQTQSLPDEPPGRVDSDPLGFRLDVTSLYGGGILVADSEDQLNLSAIFELRADLTYRRISDFVSRSLLFYGDLDIVGVGRFGGVVFVTDIIDGEIQQVAPDGTHTTWATGFAGLDSLSIAPSGDSLYVADETGVWLIRESGTEPGPVVLCHEPSATETTTLTGDPVSSLRVIFDEPVTFEDSDVTMENANGEAVGFDASGSGSQFMLIGLGEPLFGDTYTITIDDTVVSVVTGLALDGDNDGFAGGDASITITHRCPSDTDGNGAIDFQDILTILANWGPCPP